MFALLITIMTSAFMLAGCNPSSEDEVTITILQYKREISEQLEAATELYMEQNPNVTIEVTTDENYGQIINAEMGTEDAPTIYCVGGPQDVAKWEGQMYDFSGTELAEAAFDWTLDPVTGENGEVYGVPYGLEGYGIVYNKDIFEAAGVDASEIDTYDELAAAFETIDSQKEELGLDAVFCLAGKEVWQQGMHLANVYLAQDFEDVTAAYEADTVPFTRSEEMKQMYDLMVEYSYNSDAVTAVDYTTQVQQEFATGSVACILGGNWISYDVYSVSEEVGDAMGFIPVPVEGAEGKLPVGVPMYWTINTGATEEEQQAAYDFLEWLYLSEEGQNIVVNEFNFIPAYEGYEEQPSDPLGQEVYTYAENDMTYPWVFNGFPEGWAEGVLGTGIQKYTIGEMTWDEMIAYSQEEWEKARAGESTETTE